MDEAGCSSCPSEDPKKGYIISKWKGRDSILDSGEEKIRFSSGVVDTHTSGEELDPGTRSRLGV